MTQKNVCFDIRQYLINQGITEPIFIDKEPPTPNLCVTLYTNSFNAPNPKFLLNEPSIQIRVRANPLEHSQGYDLIQAIYDKLLGVPPFVLNTTRYTGILAESDIMSLGRDDRDRVIFVGNLRLFVEPLKTNQNREQL